MQDIPQFTRVRVSQGNERQLRFARGRIGQQGMSLAKIFRALIRAPGILNPLEEVRVGLGNRLGHIEAVSRVLMKSDRWRALLVNSDVQDHFAVVATRGL